MAEGTPQRPGSELDKELEHYIEEREPGGLRAFLTEQAQRSPWWAISFLVHAMALLALWRWPYPARGVELDSPARVITIAKGPEPIDTERPPDPAEPPEIDDEDVFAPIKDIPPVPLPPAPPEPDVQIDPAPDNGLDDQIADKLPSINPPRLTDVLAVRTDRPEHRRGPYAWRDPHTIEKLIRDGETTIRVQSAVGAGLRWLVRAQDRDGSWSATRWGGSDDYRVGSTALALLAFEGVGFTHARGRYKTTVRRALNWLAVHQEPSGRFPCRTFYEQGIAAMALCEAYALTRDPRVRRVAQRAIDYIVSIQPEHGGFRYSGAVPKGEGDMSVTGWQIMAVKSASDAGLTVPQEAFDRFHVFLRNSSRGYGKSAYIVGGGPGGPAIWAVGMACRQFLEGNYDAEIQAAADALLAHGRKIRRNHAKGKDRFVGDLYFTYYSTLAMYQMRGEYWREWNAMFRDPLVRAQIHRHHDEHGRFVRGSWDPANHQWAGRGGRVYSTAMAVLSLEVYYRILPLYRSRRRR